MKILSIDTSAAICAVALCEDERLIAEICLDTGNTHSETLLPAIEKILTESGTSPDSLDLLACTTGPGSFTGVRIGVATLKGLAFDKDIACVGVSSLEALAKNLCDLDGIICPVMDARRDHVYNALFKCENGDIVRLCEDRLISISELDSELSALASPIYLVGDAYDLCTKKFSLSTVCITTEDKRSARGLSVALCALEAYRRGEALSDLEIAPVYLRPSQAERERLEKEKTVKR